MTREATRPTSSFLKDSWTPLTISFIVAASIGGFGATNVLGGKVVGPAGRGDRVPTEFDPVELGGLKSILNCCAISYYTAASEYSCGRCCHPAARQGKVRDWVQDAQGAAPTAYINTHKPGHAHAMRRKRGVRRTGLAHGRKRGSLHCPRSNSVQGDSMGVLR